MKRIVTLALLAAFVLGCFGTALAATEVRMVGDARIHGTFFTKASWSRWNDTGTRTEDPFAIWERFRLRTDFIANEALKFRFGIRLNNSAWGNGGLRYDSPAIDIQVYQAYLQFKWPDTDIEITAGFQPITLPQSSIFNGSVVSDTDSAALIITAPLVEDTLSLLVGYSRLIDTNPTYDATTRQVPDEFDMFVLALPVTLDGFSFTPWGVLGIAGRNAGYTAIGDGESLQSLASAATWQGTGAWSNAQNLYWWFGLSLEVDAFDPIKFYADVIYGFQASDRDSASRGGWFIDAAVEYTGFDMLTPQLGAWWSSGENLGFGDGSERMPAMANAWNLGSSFLFDGGQFGTNAQMNINPIGAWGLIFSLNDISFMEGLTHRLTFAFANGTNSAGQVRRSGRLVGFNNGINYYTFGYDLTTADWVFGINFDHKYMIYENLAFIVETGWAHGNFAKSVWNRGGFGSRRWASAAQSGDAWKVTFGLEYKF